MEAHEQAILQFGGLSGVKNFGEIASAINRPYLGYDRRIEQKAAALVQSMACNHGFNDGNKRTALIVMELLLERSGFQLRPLRGENLNRAVENMILDVVNHRLTKPQLIRWFRDRL